MEPDSLLSNKVVGLIPLLVPVVLALCKGLIPKLNPRYLPLIAPVLGAVADILASYAGLTTLGPTWGAVLGAAGVCVREIYDQLTKLLEEKKRKRKTRQSG